MYPTLTTKVPLNRCRPTAFAWTSLLLVALATFVVACSESPLPNATTLVAGTPPAKFANCSADPAQIRTLLAQTTTNSASWLAIWDAIVSQVSQGALAPAQQDAISLTDNILSHNRTGSLQTTDAQTTSLINQLTCFVGLGSTVSTSSNAWVVKVADPTAALITSDTTSGIRFPGNAVTRNTLVTATPVNTSAITTLLDNYATVYEFTLTPAQTLTAGTRAIIGMCPDPAALARVPAAELGALLDRLVLGHQVSPTSFQVLARVPLPLELQLKCPKTASAGLHASLGRRLLNTLANFMLPTRANAANRGAFSGGVGGSTSEFSPFGPVDPQLYASGGVGGSTSEFVRTAGAYLSADPATIDGTVGTTRTGPTLPAVAVRTFLGTPIPGITVTFSTVPPFGRTPPGNATVCGADASTNALGTAAVTCLNFGTTVQYKTAYTKLAANFYLPAEYAGVDALGNPVVTISPTPQSWLVVTHGPSTLVVAQPTSGRTVANGNPYSADGTVPARVEIRSDLGDQIASANYNVTLSLNKNAFLGGGTTMSANAVGGAATFTTQIPTAASGYQFSASATIGGVTVTSNGASNLFDVVAGAAAKVTAVGPSTYSTINPSGNPLFPSPSVVVTDAGNNPTSGTKVFWTPSGASGAQVEGSATQASTTTSANGVTSATWLLGVGSNQLRASLQSGPGGAEVNFSGTLAPARNPSDPCEPGAVKDAFGNCYFVTPTPTGGTTLLRTITTMFGIPDLPRCATPVIPALRPQQTGC